MNDDALTEHERARMETIEIKEKSRALFETIFSPAERKKMAVGLTPAEETKMTEKVKAWIKDHPQDLRIVADFVCQKLLEEVRKIQ